MKDWVAWSRRTGHPIQRDSAAVARLTYNEILLRSTVKFLSNEAAQAHVQTGIDTGDPLHLKAIKTLAKRRLLYGDQ